MLHYLTYSLLGLFIVNLSYHEQQIETLQPFDCQDSLFIGQKIDSLNGIYVYYNGSTHNISGRNLSPNGYNIGLKYQCVEFVKRYYYEYLNHVMPDSYGNAVDFFDKRLSDGHLNIRRNLIQYSNSGSTIPRVNDIVVFDKTPENPYGHIAIVSRVEENEVETIQQNLPQPTQSREVFLLKTQSGKPKIQGKRILGWLRMK